MAKGKSIRVYLADGSVTGIKHAEIVNWTGQAVSFPRKQLNELNDWEEVSKPGVYFLFGSDGENNLYSYIGESENVATRIKSHDISKDFWNEVIIFTNKDENLTKGHIKYLESKIILKAKEASRYNLENGNQPQETSLPRADKDAMDEFIENLRILLGSLGHKILEPIRIIEKEKENSSNSLKIFMTHKKMKAQGFFTDEGVVVLKNSQTTIKTTESLNKGYVNLKKDLIKSAVLEKSKDEKSYFFTKDYLFSSLTAAAGVISGIRINGRSCWHNKNGQSIKEIEENFAN